MLRSIVFAIVFYLNTAAFLLIGSPLLFGPRDWAMAALKLHARVSLWWLKVIVGTDIPALGRADVAAAFRALGDHDVVVGPAFTRMYSSLALTATAMIWSLCFIQARAAAFRRCALRGFSRGAAIR